MNNDSIVPPLKTCTQCKQAKPATSEYFCRYGKSRGGSLRSECRECTAAYNRAYRAINPENREKKAARYREYQARPEVRKKITVQARERYSNDPEVRERKAARQRQYLADSKVRERINAYYRERRANNPEARASEAAISHRRRGAEGTFTAEDVRVALRSQKGKCWHCGKKVGDDYHIDHLIPLDKGGTNWPNNIVIACPTCNQSKSNKLTHEWNGKLF